MFENFSFDAPSVSSMRRPALMSPPIAPDSSDLDQPPTFFFNPSYSLSTPPLSPLDPEEDPFKRTLSTSLSTLSLADPTTTPVTTPTSPLPPSPPQQPQPQHQPAYLVPRTCVRFQRQILARLQTTDSQLRCLSSLVEEMISSRDNCSVSAAPPLHHGACGSPTASRRRRNSLPSVVSRGSGIKKPVAVKRGSAAKAKGVKGLGIGAAAAGKKRARRGAVVSVNWRRCSGSSSSSGHVSD
ncbi:uncharacterized protein LAJ45_05696 [Morchella importuna]|uniref:uncharacterized protein n=1 Tax=Morchella importuna TaxID=1174673 RepID=UPI001E8E77FD|nr:uncharacterized protein LAJ45_05696 [Morchella importuna]KAH8150010.1 hypothetical protein LAJ45_05696 [Morchella importuna]